MDELELLRAAASNANAFAELYRLHVTRIYRYHMAHVGMAKDAEDLTSQTFIAATQEFGSFHGSGSFAAWLMEIAAKKRMHDIRANRRELPIDAVLYYQTSGMAADKVAMQRTQIEAATRALKQIAPDHAEAVILTFFGGLSDSEASRILKKSTASTRMLIGRGLQELRTHSTLYKETPEDQGIPHTELEDKFLAEKLNTTSSLITPEPHFIAELEKALVANYQPRTKGIFSWRQVASLASWTLLIAVGVLLFYWRVAPNSTSIHPFFASTGPAISTPATEAGPGEDLSTPAPTVRATATRRPSLEYIVQAGDTCTYIADRFGVSINQLIRLNDLNDACDIWIDQVIVIPITPTSTPTN